MLNSSFLAIPLLFYSLVTLALPAQASELREPPIKCELTRGAWCFISGVGEIKFTPRQSEKWNKWVLYDTYWKRQVGVVLEQVDCNDSGADQVKILKVQNNVVWEGARWKEAIVSLRRDDSCKLRLMIPLADPSFVKKAASSLSGHVAACVAPHACTENILSTFVYKSLE